MRRLLLALFAVSLLVLGGSCSQKTPTLSLLVWEGYADPSYVKAFEEQNHCKVSASYMGSSDELTTKLPGGAAANYDVISPSSDVATMIATAGLAAPLDLGKLPAYSQLLPWQDGGGRFWRNLYAQWQRTGIWLLQDRTGNV